MMVPAVYAGSRLRRPVRRLRIDGMKSLLLIAAWSLLGADPARDARLDRFHQQCKEYTAQRIVKLERNARQLNFDIRQAANSKIVPNQEPYLYKRTARGRIVTVTVFPTEDEKKIYIAKIKEKLNFCLSEIKRLKAGGLAMARLPVPIEVGDLGAWPEPRMTVGQVISETEMTIVWLDSHVLLRGISTKTIAAGNQLPPPAEVFEVTGTYDHAAASGAVHKIPVIEPFQVPK